ncbi:hypothetical protein [Aureibacter tunicatorum]|uniref:RNA-binding protein with PUA domain n=1 Tax=Aureibacter tunicatorum TaxID=866807 RepID=A0AAE3XMS1_9BACT|nr:hypothetical protein [Aureibacter tunicatorum]MDR6239360.1 putative RNA-binding protein with PUA domain [Aureibacter tunicatorum]BDD04717.1 hypothetical protein AUTU_22000 [Aureibacter tunicatorum]
MSAPYITPSGKLENLHYDEELVHDEFVKSIIKHAFLHTKWKITLIQNDSKYLYYSTKNFMFAGGKCSILIQINIKKNKFSKMLIKNSNGHLSVFDYMPDKVKDEIKELVREATSQFLS